MTNLPEAMKRAGVVNQANQDVAAGNDAVVTACEGTQHGTPHPLAALVMRDGAQICPVCGKAPFAFDRVEQESINWEAHERFMRGM